MKKTTLYSVFVAVLFSTMFVSYAQELSYDWANSLIVGDGENRSVAVDSSGNSYEFGYFSGSSSQNYDFDPGPGQFFLTGTSSSLRKLFIRKLDSQGNFVWVKHFEAYGKPSQIVVDENQDIVAMGDFHESIFIETPTGTQSVSTINTNTNTFVLKLSNNGVFQWIKQTRSTSTTSKTAVFVRGGLGITANNDIIISGKLDGGTVDFDPSESTNSISNIDGISFIWKLNENGELVWVKKLGSGYNLSRDQHLDNNDNIVLLMVHAANNDLDPGPSVFSFPSTGHSVLKFDQNGTLIWGTNLGYIGTQDEPQFAINSLNDIYISASFNGFTNIAGVDPFQSYGTDEDILLIKVASDGSYGWSKHIKASGSENLMYSMTVDPIDNIYIAGATNDSIYVDPTNPNQAYVNNGGAMDTYIASYDSDGNYIELYEFRDGGSGTYLRPFQLVGTDSTFYFVGEISGSIDADAGAGTDNIAGSYLGSPFIAKYNKCSNSSVQTVTSCGSYTAGGQTYNSSGIYQLQLTNVNGCDSIVTLNLTVNNTSSSSESQTACSSYTWNGTTYTSTGIYTYTTTNTQGCDSVVTLNLTIEDVDAPIADNVTLSDITSECEVTALTPPTATDNCTGTVSGTHNATLPITAQGTTTITWTYDDGNGNTSTQTQDVVINDVTAPVVDVSDLADITSECEVTLLTPPTATDNCVGTVSGTHNTTLPITTQGTTVITWTYDDGNGNTSTQTQDVVINDVTAPVVDVSDLADITSECEVTTLTSPTATDNCVGTVSGTHNATLPITTQGTTVITWTYDDGNGNTSTQTQDVVINDVTAPVVDVSDLADITSECEVTSLTPPTATDNCVGTVTGTHNATLPITTQGTTTITWTYDDGNGNTSTQTQDVVITPIDNGVSQIDGVTLSADASGYSYQWIDCDNGNASISGETNQTFVATANGNYAVQINNGTCEVVSTCIVVNTISLDENSLNTKLVLFPNPTTENIHISGLQKEENYQILNALGKVVQIGKTDSTIHLSSISKGIYYVKIEGRPVLKFLKK